MSEPWTPGPWTVQEQDRDGYYYRWDVPEVGVQDMPEADARLIAAAPEMAALLAEWDTFPMNTVSVEDLRDRRKALLARIWGEA
jgi:hypothetical protein